MRMWSSACAVDVAWLQNGSRVNRIGNCVQVQKIFTHWRMLMSAACCKHALPDAGAGMNIDRTSRAHQRHELVSKALNTSQPACLSQYLALDILYNKLSKIKCYPKYTLKYYLLSRLKLTLIRSMI